jgi:hypothetical protein
MQHVVMLGCLHLVLFVDIKATPTAHVKRFSSVKYRKWRTKSIPTESESSSTHYLPRDQVPPTRHLYRAIPLRKSPSCPPPTGEAHAQGWCHGMAGQGLCLPPWSCVGCKRHRYPGSTPSAAGGRAGGAAPATGVTPQVFN